MGRDFTPKEHYYANKFLNGELSKNKISLNFNGESKIIHDPDSELGQTYPNMYFLCQSVLENLIQNNIPREKIQDIENTIKIVIGNDEMGIDTKYWGEQQDTKEPLKTVSKWFHGNLDSNFYYNEQNNELFLRFIKEENWDIDKNKIKSWKPQDKSKKEMKKNKDKDLEK